MPTGPGPRQRRATKIANRSHVTPFDKLAQWNAQIMNLGTQGAVPSIVGNSLEFVKLTAADIPGVMDNPATEDLDMNGFGIIRANRLEVDSSVSPYISITGINDATLTVTPDLTTTQPPWDISLLDVNGAVVQTQSNVWGNHTFTGLIPGNYIVNVVEPISGCSGSNTVLINQIPISLSLSTSVYDVNCYNGSDGKISAFAQNGALPYQFFIDGVLNTNPFPGDSVFSNLVQGVYVVSVVDDNSCMQRDTVYVNAPPIPLQALTSSKKATCHQDSTGFSVVQAVGGTPPYSYEWNTSSGVLISTDDTASSLVGGLYFVEVIDANGCDTVGSVQILTPNTAVFSTTQIGEVICKGDASGYIVGDAGGGFAPYTYTWSTSLGGVISTTSGSYNTDTLHNVSSGIYLLDIMDHYGCSVGQSSITVNEPLTALTIDTLYLIDSVYCYGDNDGRALAQFSGGDPGYVYGWDNGESTLLADSLTGGYHSFSVVDDRGCEVVDSLFIPESSEIISSLVVEDSVACYGSSNGIVSVSTTGGYSDYIYSWSTGALDTGLVDTVYNLSYGVYALTTEDSLGCSVVDSIYMAEPALLTMEAFEVAWISCYGANDGLATGVAQGGTLPYTFVWDNNQVGATVNTLSPGLHTVVVTDSRGCTASDTVFIHEPALLSVSISVVDSVYCTGASTGVLAAIVSGGTSGYTYLWDDALQASQTTDTAVLLSPDIYTVVVTDARGCTASASEDITTVTNSMTLTTLYDSVSCYGGSDGSASVVDTGGHAPYSYNWVGNNGFSLGNSPSIQNLPAGTYSVTVSDTNSCLRNTSVDIIEPLPIVYNITTTQDETCVGACDGEIYLDTLSGGWLGNYTGLVTDNTTGFSSSLPMVVSGIIPNVCSGDYTVVISDDNGCNSIVIPGGNDQAVVSSTISPLPTPLVSLISHVICNGDSTGSLEVTNSNPNSTYVWEEASNPGVVIGTGLTLSNLPIGHYIVYSHYTDNLGQVFSGCSVSSDTLTIVEPDSIYIDASIVDVSCYGYSDGTIDLLVTGGAFGYDYDWGSSQPNSSSLVNLPVGTYTCTVTDADGCVQTGSFSVDQPSPLSVSVDSSSFVLTANVPLGAGTPPYSYSWRKKPSNSILQQGGTSYSVYNPGTYVVVVTDANGCVIESDPIDFIQSWNCIGGVCVDIINGNGQYSSLSSCQASCVATGLVDIGSLEIDLSIYPNPFTLESTVDFGQRIENATITIVDAYGKLIETHELSNIDRYIIKRGQKASGIYFAEIEINKQELIRKKLIIE